MNETDLYNLIAKVLKTDVNTLTKDSALNHHPDWDSLAHIQVILALEKELGISIDDDAVLKYSSMSNIVELTLYKPITLTKNHTIRRVD